MRRSLSALLVLIALGSAAFAAGTMRFWNLTSFTVYGLQLAPVGSQAWGPNQCDNDPDKSVDPDERLKLVGVAPGRYDVKLADKKDASATPAMSRSNPAAPTPSRSPTRSSRAAASDDQAVSRGS